MVFHVPPGVNDMRSPAWLFAAAIEAEQPAGWPAQLNDVSSCGNDVMTASSFPPLAAMPSMPVIPSIGTDREYRPVTTGVIEPDVVSTREIRDVVPMHRTPAPLGLHESPPWPLSAT